MDKGIIPDVLVEQAKVIFQEKPKEKPQDIFEELEKEEAMQPKENNEDYKSDYQLMRAIDLLKAIKVFRGLNKT
jgi:hypothetical protein